MQIPATRNTNKESAFSPLPGLNRIEFLDSLRGLALFGIVLVNFIGLEAPMFGTDPLEGHRTGDPGYLARAALEVFVYFKFMPIFAFVFGLGLVLQRERALATRTPFTPFLLRRMGVMFGMGILHGILLWAGDVLAMYALFGILAAGLIRLTPRLLLILAATTLILLGIFSISPFYESIYSRTDEIPGWLEIAGGWLGVYQSSDLRSIVLARATEWKYMWITGIIWAAPYSFSFFLLGLAAGKSGLLSRINSLRQRTARMVVPAFLAGLALSLVQPAFSAGFFTYFWGFEWIFMFSGLFGSAILTLVYLAVAFAVFHSGKLPLIPGFLAAAGRMSLSNYLLQSLVANILFMGWGFGLYGRTSVEAGIAMATLLFISQIALSVWWLRHFSTGPMEWLWRKLSYPPKSG